jgi:sugar phosphate permease
MPNTPNQAVKAPQLPLTGHAAVRVISVFAFAYVLSYAFRAINAVIAPALMNDLHLSHGDLGLLSSAYLIAFGIMQLPLGIGLDRIGARRTESLLLVVGCVGAVLFSVARSLTVLWLARALIGAGVSACLMAALTAFRAWYPAERQGQLASWMLMAGTAGVLLTTIPAQALLPLVGWRGIFAGMAVLMILAIILIWTMPRIGEKPLRIQKAPQVVILRQDVKAKGYGAIFRDPYFLRTILLGFINYGGFTAIQTLWIGPWMVEVLGYPPGATARILFWFNLTLLSGFIFNGWLTPKLQRRGIPLIRYAMVLLAAGIIAQGVIVALGERGGWWLWLLFALAATGHILYQCTIGPAFPATCAGRGNTAHNLFLFAGAFIWQWAMGLAIDAFKRAGASPQLAFQASFGGLVLLQGLGWAWFFIAPRVKLLNRFAATASAGQVLDSESQR